MFCKNYFSRLTAVALFLSGSLFVFAQTSPVRGKIELKKADGTTEPVVGAMVEVFRTDSKGKLPNGKTDKKGVFSFAGFPLGQTFALSISAPTIKPAVYPNIKAGMENITITVVPGDGKRSTEEEVRQFLAAPAASTSGSASGNTTAQTDSAKPAKESAEDKKRREEEAKKIAEITANNEKIKNSDAIIQRSQEEGSKAFAAKNYDLAIAKYEEGYQASPDFVGSAPILLNNKAASYNERAVILHNQNVKITDTTQKIANKAKIKQDFADALDAYNKSLTMTKNAANSTEVPAQKIAETKLQTLRGAQNAMQFMVMTDAVDEKATTAARTLTQEYIAIETDAAKKVKAQTVLGDVFRVSGDSDNAIIEYKKALEITPDNADALAGLGLSLYNSGVLNNNNKAQMQEGLNYMTRFAEVAPANHPLKADVAGLVEYLKTAENLTPQKVTRPAGRRKQ
ncbi:MAG TPA: tetratricopeptide repeat protein [Pyrinomonadaceae bacterium]|nr:tetratricopeptide repeat protein [Pyrinomonadaceae bacterium]